MWAKGSARMRVPYNFAIVHMPGKSSVVADALSSRPGLVTAVVNTTVQSPAVLSQVQAA